MKQEKITFKLNYGGFSIGDKVYYPIFRNEYGLGVVVAGKIERRRYLGLSFLPFTYKTAILVIKVGSHYFEEPAHKCYKIIECED